MSESISNKSNLLPLSPSKSTKSNHHQVDGILSSPPIPTTTANNLVKDRQSSINQSSHSHPNDDTPPPSSPIQPALGIPLTRDIHKNPNPFINSLSSPFSSSSSSSKSTSTTTPSLTALALGASPTKPTIQKSKPSTHLNASRNTSPSTDPKAGFKKLDNDQLKLEKDLVDQINKKRTGGGGGGEKQQPLTPVTHLLLGSYSHSLVLGRGKPNGAAHNSSALINANGRMMGMGNGTGRDPESPSPSTSSGLGAKKSQHVLLPNTARHVSRAHAVVEYIPFSPSKDASNAVRTATGEGSFVVRILGQNGLIVNGKRRKEGSVIPLVPASSSGNGNQAATLLDFFGMCARFDVVGPAPSFSRSNTTMAFSNKPRSSLSEKLGLTRNGNLQNGTSPIKSSNLTHKPRKSLLGSSIPTSTSTSSKTVKSTPIPAALAASSPISSSPSLRHEIPSSPSALRGDANGSDLSSSPSSVDQEQRRDEDQDGDGIMNESNSPSRGRGNSKGVGKGQETFLGKRSRNGSSQKEKKRISNTTTSSGRRHHSRSNTRAISTTREDQNDVTLEIVPDSQMDLDDSEEEDEDQSQIQKGEERVVDSNSESESESDSDSSRGEESELTPSPSASPEPIKRRHHQNNKKQRLEESSPTRNQGEEELSESQVQMPPPALPNKNRVKFLEAQVDSSSTPTSSSSSDSSSSSSLQTLARYCISILSPTYDLEGLLAGSIVFHRTATISATEAVKSVLAGTPSMMKGQAGGVAADLSENGALSSKLKHGDVVPGWKGLGLKDTPLEIRNLFGNDKFKVDEEKWSSLVRRAWREKLEIVLQSKEMFGVIQRKGRDASGNPLEHWYYYDHSLDTDSTRAANLGAFAKPIRGALKTQKAVVWQRRTYNHSNEWDGAVGTLPTTASTSSSSTFKEKSKIDDSLVGFSQSINPNHEEFLPKVDKDQVYQNAVWQETQPAEEEESTWDRVGDMDYKEKVEKRRK